MINALSISGGKDSTAMLLLAIERAVENPHFVFCDTGNEAQATMDYIEYLNDYVKEKAGVEIEVLRLDLSEKLTKKASETDDTERATALLAAKNESSVFLQLAAMKGRFRP